MKKLVHFLICAVISSASLLFAQEAPPMDSVESIQQEMTFAPSEDEVAAMDHLIAVTDQQLKVQKEVRELMVLFKRHKKRFIDGDQSKKQAYQMVKTADEILKIVHAHHLQHLYSQDYLEELTMFSSIAGKNTPVRP